MRARLTISGYGGDPGMPLRQLQHGIGGSRSDVVHVQLGLGQAVHEGPQVVAHRFSVSLAISDRTAGSAGPTAADRAQPRPIALNRGYLATVEGN